MSDPNLTLHYDFAADKSLAARIGPTLAITRATSATFFNSSGLIETAASGVARFGYDPVSRISKGLLVEQVRTNLLLQSEDNGNAVWTNNSSTDAQDNIIAPDGTLTADSMIDTAASTIHYMQQVSQAHTSAAVVTFSTYIKEGDQPIVALFEVGASLGTFFNLTDQTTATFNADPTSSSITDVGNGWFRLSITFTSTGTTSTVRIYSSQSMVTATYLGAGTNAYFMWGSQFEAGELATSYIPTTTVSVTRNADVPSTTDLTWLNTAEGTLFTDIDAPTHLLGGGGTPFIIAIDDGTAVDRILQTLDREPAHWDVHAFLTAASANTVVALDTTINAVGGERLRVANAWKANDHALSVNGNASILDATVTVPAGLTVLRLGEPGEVQQLNTHYREIRYYNVRKDNTFIESLSNGIINEDSINLSSNLANSTARKTARPY